MENTNIPKEEAVKANGEQPPVKERKKSSEALFGTLLLVVLILCVIGAVAGVGFAAYSKWKMDKADFQELSIKELPVETETVKTEPDKAEQAPKPSVDNGAVQAAQDAAVSAKQKDISVLNGGAAKGMAGVAVGLLKQAGYTKVTAGNTVTDYVGATIYYAVGLENEAGAVKAALVGKYPALVLKPAIATNKETSVASLTVILGK